MRNESVWLAGRSVGWSEISLKKSEIDHKKIKKQRKLYLFLLLLHLTNAHCSMKTSVCNVMCTPPHTTSLDQPLQISNVSRILLTVQLLSLSLLLYRFRFYFAHFNFCYFLSIVEMCLFASLCVSLRSVRCYGP